MNSINPNADSDDELIRRHLAGDPDAFAELMNRHRMPLLKLLRNRFGAGREEDLSQETWLKVYKNLNEYREHNFRSWLFKIAKHSAIDDGRKMQRRKDDRSLGPANEPFEEHDASARMARLEELAAFKPCVEKLSTDNNPIYVDAFIRVKVDEQPAEELAAELGIKRSVVDQRVSRGKKMLQECMEKKSQ